MFNTPPVVSHLHDLTAALQRVQSSVKKAQQPKKEDVSALIKILRNSNAALADPNLLKDKKVAQDSSVNEAIKQALEAVLIFQKMNSNSKELSQKGVREMVAALFASIEKEKDLMKFEANIKNLKKRWKELSQHVESSEKSNLQ